MTPVETAKIDNKTLWSTETSLNLPSKRSIALVTIPVILSSIDSINADWLQTVFHSAGHDTPPILDVRVEPFGHGTSSETVKIHINYAEYDKAVFSAVPRSVVCKFHAKDEHTFEATKSNGIFVTEANMLKLLAAEPEVCMPSCYFVAVADDGGDFNLVMQDLTENCIPGDQISGCSVKEAEATVRALAGLHRRYWNEPLLDKLTWVKPRIPFPSNASALLHERLNRLLDAEQHDCVNDSIPKILDWLGASPKNQTLIHGDCRVDNVLFDVSDKALPRAYLIDFALGGIGDASSDLAYFLTSSLAPEDLSLCEMGLIALHTQYIAEKDNTYTLDQAIESYRKNIFSSLHMTLLSAMHIPDTSHNSQMIAEILGRNCAAIERWTQSSFAS